jgi:hypothetical protein
MDAEQKQRFEQALERKQEDARRKGETQAPRGAAADPTGVDPGGQAQDLLGADRVQDTNADPRAKNSGHRKMTADKWNQ